MVGNQASYHTPTLMPFYFIFAITFFSEFISEFISYTVFYNSQSVFLFILQINSRIRYFGLMPFHVFQCLGYIRYYNSFVLPILPFNIASMRHIQFIWGMRSGIVFNFLSLWLLYQSFLLLDFLVFWGISAFLLTCQLQVKINSFLSSSNWDFVSITWYFDRQMYYTDSVMFPAAHDDTLKKSFSIFNSNYSLHLYMYVAEIFSCNIALLKEVCFHIAISAEIAFLKNVHWHF